MLMEMSMKASGKMIKHMEQGTINMLMELLTRVNGRMISNMEKELRRGLTVQGMKGATLRGRSMGKDSSSSQMEVSIMEIFSSMKYQERESTCGQTKRPLMASGKRTKCMATEC